MNKKKVITNTFITVIAGLLALLFYSSILMIKISLIKLT